jgi:hypothetical protein
MDPEEPSRQETSQHDHLTDQTGCLRADAIHKKAVDHTQNGSGEKGNGDHEAFLGSVKLKIRSRLNTEWAQDDPDHKGHIEVKESSKQRRRVACLQELFVDHN